MDPLKLRGMATVNVWADDVAAARDWYANLFGEEAYFQLPSATEPAYVEFRLGDRADEFGIVDRRHAPFEVGAPGGAILYWHVDDLEVALAAAVSAGARPVEPITKRGDSGFVTASVADPFGNVLGLMTNPHFEAMSAGRATGDSAASAAQVSDPAP